MSDGNKFDLTSYARQRQQAPTSLEEMGNVLLDAMQGTLICLDNHHIIIDVSKTIKQYFGFEQCDIVGISILLLIEDSERDLFLKFLSSTSQLFDICYVRMMIAISNEYRQVKVHRKRKFSQDNADVHSTTAISNGSLGSILVLTLEDSSFIDLSLPDIYKQEFYTKMNLLGEITFEDHRGTLITGYLPHELTCQSIFNFVYHEDRLVKLHALWKCVTTGASKLQWRFNARDGSLVFLQTEYKLVANHQDHEIIVARNEVLSPVQRSQFEELQTAWRHQCAADIKGNSSSFKLITSIDIDPLSISSGQCCISVPSLNMCFSTKKLQSLHIQGNIFDGTKQTRPLTIQDYISLLIEHDKYLDNELMNIINNISNITSRTKRQTNENDSSDVQMKEKTQDDDLSRRKSDSDSIVRGILNNSIKYTQEKPTGDLNSTFNRLLNGNSQTNESPLAQQTNQMNQVILNPEAIQQQHIDFIKKYRSAKAKLESQLESTRTQELANGGQTNDALKRHTILNKLAQLENIKNKHLARTFELQRQTQQAAVAPQLPLPPPAPAQPVNQQQKDLMNNYFPSPSPKSSGLMSTDSNPPTHPINQSALYNTPPNNFYPQQQKHPPTIYRTYDSNPPPYHDLQSRMKMPVFDEYSTPPPSYMPMNNSSLSVHSYMNVSFQETNTNSPSTFNHHNTTYPF